MTIDREILAASFEHSAESYERGRPGYPAVAVAHLAAELGIGPGCRLLDLAAGTGKLSRQLHALGADVVAVEPSAAMRNRFAAGLPGVEVHSGAAEAIPLADSSVDLVAVAQAFHWFDVPKALGEIARVLRPGGSLAAIWNEAHEVTPEVKRLFTAMRSVGNRPDTIEADWRIPFDESGHFEPARRARFRWTDELSHDELLASVESRSYVTVLDPEPKAEFLTMIRSVIADFPEPWPLPYVTEVYWCRKSDPSTSS